MIFIYLLNKILNNFLFVNKILTQHQILEGFKLIISDCLLRMIYCNCSLIILANLSDLIMLPKCLLFHIWGLQKCYRTPNAFYMTVIYDRLASFPAVIQYSHA